MTNSKETNTKRHRLPLWRHMGVKMEHRVANLTGSCGNSGRCSIYALAEELSIQFRESKTPGHKIKR